MTLSADQARMHAVERAVQDIRDAVGQIAEAMVKIARLEERHQETRESLGRAFDRLDVSESALHDVRVEIVTLRADIKPLQESRDWIVRGMVGIVSLVGVAVVGLVLAAKQ